MEELIKRNGKGIWMREIEKVLKRFNSSLEWLMGRMTASNHKREKLKRSDRMTKLEKTRRLSW